MDARLRPLTDARLRPLTDARLNPLTDARLRPGTGAGRGDGSRRIRHPAPRPHPPYNRRRQSFAPFTPFAPSTTATSSGPPCAGTVAPASGPSPSVLIRSMIASRSGVSSGLM